MPSSRSRWGRILFPVLFYLASVTEGSAQPARTQGWVFGLGSGTTAVSFESDPADGAALVGLRIGYGLNRIVTPYLGGEYADIRSRGLEAFDRMTFAHVDLGVRLHLTGGGRRWVPFGDLALTFWQVSDVLENGERTTSDFTSMPTFNRDRGEPRGSAPPTPPCVRVRTRRFDGVKRHGLRRRMRGRFGRRKRWAARCRAPG